MLKKSRPAFSVIFILLLSPIFAQPQGSLQEIEAFIQQYLPQTEIPGLAVAIVMDDQIVFEQGYGLREIGKSDQVDQHTLFAVASNTKAFTAALLARLVEQGQITWDDKVINFYPSLQMFDPFVTRDINIEDLLTHRVGLPTFGGDHLWIGNNLTRGEIISRLRYLEPTAQFRTKFQYQNLMYLLAGELVPAISGLSWDEAIARHFFEPLKMDRSSTSIKALPAQKNVAQPHERVDGKIRAVAYDNLDNVAPAAAINSSAHDMSGWMRLQLNRGGFEGQQILQPATIDNMHQVHFALPVSSRSREWFDADFSGYGLGWFISQYRGHKLVSHSGGMSGMISLQLLVPDKDLGIIILTNFAPNSSTRVIGYSILDRLLDIPPHDWQQRYTEAVQRAEAATAERERLLNNQRKEDTRPSHSLDDYVGHYSSQLSGPASVRIEKGQLVFDYNERHVGQLEHWHFDTFRVHWRHPIFDMDSKTFLSFEVSENGEVDGLTVRFYDPLHFQKE